MKRALRTTHLGLSAALALVLGGTASAQQEVPPPPPNPTVPTVLPPAPPEQGAYADTDPSALTDFRAELAPYGQWVDDPTYGVIWIPSPNAVGLDFTPYVTDGHWAYDQNGAYTWVSDYPWGWATFHYGRWFQLPDGRWAWVPGRDYAGAWVEWREGDGYVGWAPMPPSFEWQGGVAVPSRVTVAPRWTFAHGREIFEPRIGQRVIVGDQARAVAPHTRAVVVEGERRPAARVAGPPPARLGVPPQAVVHVAPEHRGVVRAQQFARPETAPRAIPQAHPPAQHPAPAPPPPARAAPPPPQQHHH